MSLPVDTIKEQLKNLITQRDSHATMFQKCSGAIDILTEQLKIIESDGEIENGSVEGEDSQQTTEI